MVHQAISIYKGKSSKYKGNFGYLVFRFLGMLMNFFATLKPGALLLRSCRFHRHPYMLLVLFKFKVNLLLRCLGQWGSHNKGKFEHLHLIISVLEASYQSNHNEIGTTQC